MKKELKFSRMKTGVLIILLILVFSANPALGGFERENFWNGFNMLVPGSIEFKEEILTVKFRNSGHEKVNQSSIEGGVTRIPIYKRVRVDDISINISINYEISECDVAAELGKLVEVGDTFTVKALNCVPEEEFRVLIYEVSIDYTYLPDNITRTSEGSIWIYPEEPEEGLVNNLNILMALVAVSLIVFAYYVKKKHGSETLINWYRSLFTIIFPLYFILLLLCQIGAFGLIRGDIWGVEFLSIFLILPESMTVILLSIAPSVFARHNTKETITLAVFILISLLTTYFAFMSGGSF